jgi:hypothetical protein
MKKYKIQQSPFVVPTTDGKLIEEHWGNSTGNSNVSIAHMVAPPDWSEPHQTLSLMNSPTLFQEKNSLK